jgi:heme exporter protein A
MPQPAALGQAPMLRLDTVACARGGRVLWRGLSLDLAPGGLVHVRGINGCGKSSLLRLAAGFLPPLVGKVARAGDAGLVDEAHGLDADRPLEAALLFWAKLTGGTPMLVNDAMARTGIQRLAEVPVHMLSTGQKKRAALARLLLTNPKLWLLDEPANGLDDAGMAMLGGLIAEHRASGGAVLLASHQPVPVTDAITLTLADYAPRPNA